MKICLLGLDNLPALIPEFRQHTLGGESIQQTLLARALARRGHAVSTIVYDHGQPEEVNCRGVRVLRAYRPAAGWPVIRFLHPRWTRLWSALERADADLYYTSCAGAQVGLLALYCRRNGKRFVFRSASDADCDPSQLLIRFARDRWLYGYGLRRAHAILVQSAAQAEFLIRGYGLPSRIAAMFVEPASPAPTRDIDLLWVGNIRGVKRPDRMLELARQFPNLKVHMVGGSLAGEERLFCEVRDTASRMANVVFHGQRSYWDTNDLYGRARLLVNTSEVEGFPNSYLQAWIRGVPVVSLFDPDSLIKRKGLGLAVRSLAGMPVAIRGLLTDFAAWSSAADRCRRFMARHFADDDVLAAYVDTFERVLGDDGAGPATLPAGKASHG